ncbi:Ras GTP exchange factor [Thecamonas trahens ATCC 50062]|uniref:Ras GTP exchange factor n=1 Tax=Thecamonas trahens ATCC 50062 TaxID=461836 RepID=A0A0L0DDT7_THETB|nr:Ras GTP exchange factor [Thecamonas trahens ATCC 50062]KNC49478.1 Ras GTP exchange factor [Thecamonas trahens ATCC 50062]|eukprot:XP_013757897.1 Ras GTP exchange factor [Thecamonas trahens ATCC 50062]
MSACPVEVVSLNLGATLAVRATPFVVAPDGSVASGWARSASLHGLRVGPAPPAATAAALIGPSLPDVLVDSPLLLRLSLVGAPLSSVSIVWDMLPPPAEDHSGPQLAKPAAARLRPRYNVAVGESYIPTVIDVGLIPHASVSLGGPSSGDNYNESELEPLVVAAPGPVELGDRLARAVNAAILADPFQFVFDDAGGRGHVSLSLSNSSIACTESYAPAAERLGVFPFNIATRVQPLSDPGATPFHFRLHLDALTRVELVAHGGLAAQLPAYSWSVFVATLNQLIDALAAATASRRASVAHIHTVPAEAPAGPSATSDELLPPSLPPRSRRKSAAEPTTRRGLAAETRRIRAASVTVHAPQRPPRPKRFTLGVGPQPPLVPARPRRATPLDERLRKAIAVVMEEPAGAADEPQPQSEDAPEVTSVAARRMPRRRRRSSIRGTNRQRSHSASALNDILGNIEFPAGGGDGSSTASPDAAEPPTTPRSPSSPASPSRSSTPQQRALEARLRRAGVVEVGSPSRRTRPRSISSLMAARGGSGNGSAGEPPVPDALVPLPDNEYLIDEAGRIIAGSSTALVALLLDIKYNVAVDRFFAAAFFRSCTAFVDVAEVRREVLGPVFDTLAQAAPPEGDPAAPAVAVSDMFSIKHVVSLMAEWGAQAPEYLKEGPIRTSLDELVGELQAARLVPLAARLSAALDAVDASLPPSRFDLVAHTVGLWPEYGLQPPGLDATSRAQLLGLLDEFDPPTVAYALTILEGVLFTRVDVHGELAGLAWSKPGRETAAPNVMLLIGLFNALSRWVVSAALSHKSSAKARGGVLTKFIELADELRLLGNYSGVMEVVAGLSASEVKRTRKAWALVPKVAIAKHEVLKTLTGQAKSYKYLREALAISDLDHPPVPYLGMFLTDLTMIDDGNPTYLPSACGALRLINVRKWRLLSAVHEELIGHQDRFCEWAGVPRSRVPQLPTPAARPVSDLPRLAPLVRAAPNPQATAAVLARLVLLLDPDILAPASPHALLSADDAYELSLELEPRRPRK